jgi:hypothetical protein
MEAPQWDDMSWFKSTRSAGNGACVEVAFADGLVGVRDSKDPHGPVLAFTGNSWTRFVQLVSDGRTER